MPTIPGHATEIRYQRTGPLAGKYYHRFGPGVRMRANADGSVTLRGRRRIHATEDEAGFWQKYGGRHRRNPGLFSALARGARSGYHSYRAGRYASKAARHRQKASAFMVNPRRRRAQQSDSILLWLLIGFGVYLYATRAQGGELNYLPQPFGYWFNPQTSQLYLADGTGRPPGAVPPWRLASEAEILNVVGP